MFFASECFQLPCVESTNSKTPPPIPPPRSKHKHVKRLSSIEETKTASADSGQNSKAKASVQVSSVEEEEGKAASKTDGSETAPAVVLEDSNNNPSVETLTVPKTRKLSSKPARPPSPLLLTADSCTTVAHKSVSTGSVHLECLEGKSSLCKTLSDQGAEGRAEQEEDKPLLRRSLSDSDKKGRDHNHLLKDTSSSVPHKQKNTCAETAEVNTKLAQVAGVEGTEDTKKLQDSEESGKVQEQVEDALRMESRSVELSDPTSVSKSFFRRVSVKLKSSFSGKNKSDCEEDTESKFSREKAKSLKEKKVEVLDLTEDSQKKPVVRKVSVVEMCSARRAGRYPLSALAKLGTAFCTLC